MTDEKIITLNKDTAWDVCAALQMAIVSLKEMRDDPAYTQYREDYTRMIERHEQSMMEIKIKLDDES